MKTKTQVLIPRKRKRQNDHRFKREYCSFQKGILSILHRTWPGISECLVLNQKSGLASQNQKFFLCNGKYGGFRDFRDFDLLQNGCHLAKNYDVSMVDIFFSSAVTHSKILQSHNEAFLVPSLLVPLNYSRPFHVYQVIHSRRFLSACRCCTKVE